MKQMVLIFLVWAVLFSVPATGDQGQLEKIQQIPDISQVRTRQAVHIGEFNGSGFIDDIQADKMVINDTRFEMAPGIKKTDLSGIRYGGKLEKGIFVYYFLDSENKISKIVVEQ